MARQRIFDIVRQRIYFDEMNERAALAWLQKLTADEGVKDGIETAAGKLNLGWNTVYGWYRRQSIPQWRLRDIEAVAYEAIAPPAVARRRSK